MKKPKNAEDYIGNYPQWESSLNKLRALMLDTGMTEAIKWASPVYMLNNENVCALAAGKEFYGLWFFQGALLEDKFGLLANAQEGKTQAMRHLRFYSKEEYREEIVVLYTQAGMDNAIAGRKVILKREPKPKWPMPSELKVFFEKNPAIELAFEQFSPSKQQEFLEYIGSAKQSSTRQRRADKSSNLILRGEGLNDRYRNK